MILSSISVSKLRLSSAALVLLLLLGATTIASAQNSEEGSTAMATKAKKHAAPKGILQPLFTWADNPEHGIFMGVIQSMDMAQKSITVLNQPIFIDDSTVFLGRLNGFENLKVGRAIAITTQVSKDKIQALEIYRIPKPPKKNAK